MLEPIANLLNELGQNNTLNPISFNDLPIDLLKKHLLAPASLVPAPISKNLKSKMVRKVLIYLGAFLFLAVSIDQLTGPNLESAKENPVFLCVWVMVACVAAFIFALETFTLAKSKKLIFG